MTNHESRITNYEGAFFLFYARRDIFFPQLQARYVGAVPQGKEYLIQDTGNFKPARDIFVSRGTQLTTSTIGGALGAGIIAVPRQSSARKASGEDIFLISPITLLLNQFRNSHGTARPVLAAKAQEAAVALPVPVISVPEDREQAA